MTNDTLNEILELLARHLPRHDRGWAVTGTASLQLRGVVEGARDIDILALARTARIAAITLRDSVVCPLAWSESAGVRSLFARYAIAGVSVEIMANVYNRRPGGGWRAHREWRRHLEYYTAGTTSIPLLELAYELRIARMLQQVDRIALITRYQDLHGPPLVGDLAESSSSSRGLDVGSPESLARSTWAPASGLPAERAPTPAVQPTSCS